jgi:hypothetical protein
MYENAHQFSLCISPTNLTKSPFLSTINCHVHGIYFCCLLRPYRKPAKHQPNRVSWEVSKTSIGSWRLFHQSSCGTEINRSNGRMSGIYQSCEKRRSSKFSIPCLFSHDPSFLNVSLLISLIVPIKNVEILHIFFSFQSFQKRTPGFQVKVLEANQRSHVGVG